MDPERLRDRLRGIVGDGGSTRASIFRSTAAVASVESGLERGLGGEWRNGCFVIERVFDAGQRHGRRLVGDLHSTLNAAAPQVPLIANGTPARAPLLFFDIETTGLSGGAGTLAFLVGFGWFERGSFMTRQYLLVRFADERPMLAAIGDELARAGAMVSFNGKSFDAPVLETRYLFHRVDWVGGRLPHVDVLHPARRFWQDSGSGCSLGALEERVLAAPRSGDVAGFEIPSRYFQFVRSGDIGPMAAVLEHNRLDLLSLAGLTVRLLDLLQSGAGATDDPREALALAGLYARAGFEAEALEASERAVELSAPLARTRPVEAIAINALRTLAFAYRRARRHDEAAACWSRLLRVDCSGRVQREALEALAIYHEHRARDLSAARGFAARRLEEETRPIWRQAVQHRLARLDRKMSAKPAPMFDS